jgi:hypothetical protein
VIAFAARLGIPGFFWRGDRPDAAEVDSIKAMSLGCVAVRRSPTAVTRCAAPSEATETAGVFVVLRGLGDGHSKDRTCDLGFRNSPLAINL